MSKVLQAGKMYRPTAMDFDSTNNAVFVVEQYNHRVSKWIYSNGLFDFKLDAGQVTSITITDGGLSYVALDPIVISAPTLDISNPETATAEVATVNGSGTITGITIIDGGNGYDPSNLPTVTADETTGSGAILAAVVSTPWGTNENGTSGVPGVSTSDTDDRLQFPTGMARLIANQTLFVSDTLNHRVRVMNKSTGFFTNSFGSPGTGDDQLYRPAHLADNEDNLELAVMDSRNHRVAIYNNSTFAFIGFADDPDSPEKFHTPWGAKQTPNATLGIGFYYTDIIRGKVHYYDDTAATYIKTIGTPGTDPTDPNQLFYPGASNGTPVDNETAYMPDTRNNKIKVFDSSGTFTTQIGVAGTGDGQLYWPEHATGFSNTGTNYLCVCNTLNNRVEVYDRSSPHEFQTSFGSP